MKERILKAIELQNGKLTFKNLHKKFDIDKFELQGLLQELKLDGKILQVSNKYMVFPKDLLIGNVNVTSTGRKYIFYNGERVPVSSNFFNNIILGDVVSFKINDNNEAEIVTIIDRTLGDMTCTIMNVNGKKKIIPYHNGVNITLPKDVTDTLVDGDIILVNVKANDIDEFCDAKFIKRLGNKNDPGKLEETIARNYGFDNDYSSEYLEEIEKYPTSVSEEEIQNRYDFRWQKSCTIDGINTKDMDDGLYAELLENGNIRVYVHIADVSHYVKPGSKAFERACEKTTSAYLNNSVFHMLHYKISNGICSLNPYEDRLAKTVIMDIDELGNIVDFNVVKSVINSKKKMTYDDVDKILLNEEIVPGYEEFIPYLEILNMAALRLEEKSINENGKIEFASTKVKKVYNSDGSIKEIHENYEYSPAEKLIENLMIAANKTVASWLYYLGMPSVYRIHELPNKEKINLAIDTMNESGFKIRHVHNVDTPQEMQRLLSKLKNLKEFPILSQILVMAMQRARYSTDNLGHFALGEEAYTHFTSPIRRLPDLLVHTIIDLVILNYDKISNLNLEEIEKGLEELCKHASKMERQADAASMDAERVLVIEKMEKHIGEEFEAIICNIDDRIRIKLWGIDTYINPNDFEDNFAFDSSSKLYYDKETGKHLNLGTSVVVKLIDANSANRSFKVNVLAPVIEKSKKKVLKKD